LLSCANLDRFGPVVAGTLLAIGLSAIAGALLVERAAMLAAAGPLNLATHLGSLKRVRFIERASRVTARARG
jgi:hypothetical protein